MTLPLLVKFGKIGHQQYSRTRTWQTAEQGNLQTVFIPILPERTRDSGCFGSLQILVYGPETDRASAGDLPQI